MDMDKLAKEVFDEIKTVNRGLYIVSNRGRAWKI
jgi:hypothetical protein